MVKCGNRKRHGEFTTYHMSAADVKACFAGRIVDGTSQNIDFAAREAAEYAAAAPVQDKPARQATDNERRVLDRMRSEIHADDPTAAARSERYRQIWAGDEATGPVDEGNWSEFSKLLADLEEDMPAPPPREHFFGSAGDATAKQVEFVQRLVTEKQVDQLPLGWIVELEDRIHTGDLGKADASKAISRLLALPKVTKVIATTSAQPAYATEDGIYRNPTTGEIFKLQFNRAQGDGRHLYAKQLLLSYYDEDAGEFVTEQDIPLGQGHQVKGTDLDWKYVGAVSKAGVLPAWRVTKEEAAAFGKLYGVCVRCHRDLTAEESIERAMGPICAGKMGW